MNLLHIAPYTAPAFAFGGVPRAVDGLTRALAHQGHTVTVLTTDAGTPTARVAAPRDEMRQGVRIVRVPNLSVWARGRLNLSSPIGIRGALRDLLPGITCVHLHELRTVENLLTVPIVTWEGVPIVLSPHGTLDLTTGRPALKKLWDRAFPVTAWSVQTVVALTDAERDEARAAWVRFGGEPPRFRVIPNGVDLEAFAHLPDPAPFRARWGLDDAPVCLFMGRLHPRKGVGVLAQAFLRMTAEHGSDARLLVVGGDEGALAGLRALASADRRIVITGYLDGADRLGALACADLFALPAVGEGQPMAALEAMACGIPAILSPGCNLPAAAQAGAALIVEPQIAPLADALHVLLSDRVRRADMGARARELVASQFTWDKIATIYSALYARYVRVEQE
ncbi:MAG: glycosyltransferase [Chloroflexota bacterium]|nr:glycosyltransferase [Chloroflexota bacterium]